MFYLNIKSIVKKIINIIGKRDFHNPYHPYLKDIIEKYLVEPDLIVELNCSNGETTVCNDNQVYINIDYEYKYLNNIQSTFIDNNYIFIQKNILQIPLASSYMDGVYCLGTLSLIDEELMDIAFSETLRVSKNNSLFIFQFLNNNSIQYITMKKQFWDSDYRFYYRALSYMEQKRILKRNSFKIIEEYSILLIPYFLVVKLGWRWLFKLDIFLSRLLPWFACKNIFVCKKN